MANATSKRSACPICTRPSDDHYRPFCSRRCADIDLSRWLNGAYAIPDDEDEDGAETPDGPDIDAPTPPPRRS